MTVASGADDTLSQEQVVKELASVLASGKARRLTEAMREAGCPVSRAYFHVMDCKQDAAGGYSPTHGVILCRNQFRTTWQVRSTVIHELIHAYDDCQAKARGGLNWNDCQQHACTEVRAASLSGDCDWEQEAWRGNVSHADPSSWFGYHRRCVERRAALSVSLNPHCKQPGCASAAVQQVMERCMADNSPFDAG